MSSVDPYARWTSLTYAVVDVEGNGQQPPDLVELAVVPVVGGQIGEPATWLVRPHRPILPVAQRVHRISDVDVASGPPIGEVAGDVGKVLDNAVFVAHNARIDLAVLA